jgi:CubicO group peptidase (beta-lactamase class C family)
MANLEHGVPLSTKSVFEIGSDSKKFTAFCVTLLARPGKLSLDDEIQKFLPEMRHYENPITIRQLIHHTSGLRDYLSIGYLAGFNFDNAYPADEVLGLIARQKGLNFLPGTEHLYSNTNYLLLAEIIKRVSGMTLRAFADQNIFAPLGMKNTHFHDDHKEVTQNRAIGYSPKKHGGFQIDMTNFDMVGDKGIYTTVEDLCLWDANFYNNILGGYGQDLIEEATTPGKLSTGKTIAYAFGLDINSYRGLKVVEHGGACNGYRSQMVIFPEQRLSIICLSNRGDCKSDRLAKQIADIYLAGQFTAPVTDKTPKSKQQFVELSIPELEAKVGVYRDTDGGGIWELTVQAGKLMVEVQAWAERFEISPTQPNHFISLEDAAQRVVIEFEQRAPQDLGVMRVQVNEGKLQSLNRMDAVVLTSDQLDEYAGDYVSEELGANCKLLVKEGKIVFCLKGEPQVALVQVNRTNFIYPLFCLFEFVFDQQDHITGFDLSTGRVRGIHFVKD